MRVLITLLLIIILVSCREAPVGPIELTLDDYMDDYQRIISVVAVDYNTGDDFTWQLPTQVQGFYEGYKSVNGDSTEVEFIGGWRNWDIPYSYVYGADIMLTAHPYEYYTWEHTWDAAWAFPGICAFYSVGYPYVDTKRTDFDPTIAPLNLIVTGFGVTNNFYAYPVTFYDISMSGYPGTPQLYSSNAYIAGKYCAVYDIANNFGDFTWDDITLAFIETSTQYGEYELKNGYGIIQPYRALQYLYERK